MSDIPTPTLSHKLTVPPFDFLTQARLINDEHLAVEKLKSEIKAKVSETLKRAMDCGDKLLRVKAAEAPGGYEKWCRNNLTIKNSTVRLYTQLARHRKFLELEIAATPEGLSIREARQLITVPKADEGQEKPKPDLVQRLIEELVLINATAPNKAKERAARLVELLQENRLVGE